MPDKPGMFLSRLALTAILCAAWLVACAGPGPVPSPSPTAGGSTQAVRQPTATGTQAPIRTSPPAPSDTPAPTPVPLAASVNGEGITLEEFEQEISRFELAQASLGIDPAALGNYRATVLETLIQQKVMELAALQAGLSLSEEELQAQVDQIFQSTGGEQAFTVWLEANLYTTLQFRVALKSQILASRITEQIAGLAPTTAEHIHARHILVATESEALDLLAQIQQGADLAILALTYSLDLSTRAAGGDLGWFPRGLLTAPEAEEAAFGLQPDEISGVIRSSMGFHIIQSLGRDPDRELSPEALQLYRTRTVEAWLAEQMAAAQIERMITP